MDKLKVMIEVLKDCKLTISGLIGILFLFYDYTSIIGFILIFNAFDLLGFRNVLQAQFRDYDKNLASYRVMQFMFEITLLSLIGFAHGWIFGVVSKLLHWFAVQDIVYYLVGGYEFPKVWNWLKWTPLGIIKGDLSSKEVIAQAFAGLIIIIILMGIYA